MHSPQEADRPYVVREDNHLLVCHKPAGMPVQADASGDLCLVDWAKAYIKAQYAKPGEVFVGLVHRLDRPVSGLVILAKTSKALARLNQAVAQRTIQKRYLALVGKAPEPTAGVLVDFLMKNADTNTSRRVSPKHPHGKRAELTYQVLAEYPSTDTLVAINLHTGRHHQIRVQLASRGWAIVGDVKYGGQATHTPASIHLHAAFLAFQHPVTQVPVVLEHPPLWALQAPPLADIF